MDDDRDEIPTELRDAVVRLVEETYPEPAGHPETERWEAYLQGELAADEEGLLAEHLVRCRDCFDLVQAIDAFAAPVTPADLEREPPPGAEVAAAALSRLVLQQVQDAPAAPSAPLPPLRAPTSARFRSSGSMRALAAVLALAVVGLTGWGLRQRDALARQRAPQVNAQILDLFSGERAAAAPKYQRVARPGPLTIVLHPAEERPDYDLVVREAASGRERFVLPGLQPDEDLALTLHLPEGLPPGSYRLEIRPGGDSPQRPPLEEFPLRIEEGSGREHGS